MCGIACVDKNTKVATACGNKRICDVNQLDRVLSYDAQGNLSFQSCSLPFPKHREQLVRVQHQHGQFFASERHAVFCSDHVYRRVDQLCQDGQQSSFSLLQTSLEPCPSTSLPDALHSIQTVEGFLEHCSKCYRQYGQLPLEALSIFQASVPLLVDALKCIRSFLREDDPQPLPKHIHPDQCIGVLQNLRFLLPLVVQVFDEEGHNILEQTLLTLPTDALAVLQSLMRSERRQPTHESAQVPLYSDAYYTSKNNTTKIISVEKQAENWVWDLTVPATGNWIDEHGVVHHNTGKTYTGAHFVIQHMILYPDLTGCIAANNYDQLSQATLRELMYWLEQYEIPYVIDRQPPKEWACKRAFKSYRNILSVKMGTKVVHAFTRVLSNGDALRGIEFSWYWLDETRDTPLNTHDIILSRCRESDYVKGLITTTTAGEDWCHDRFVKKGNRKGGAFGSLHVRTSDSVRYGIITDSFYQTLRSAYSPMMAAQELDAEHVNVNSGRAYYTASSKQQARVSPWGLEFPDPELPIIVGMDFNYAPAPMVWCVGQLSPEGTEIHWFEELSEVEISSREMARRLGSRYPDSFLRIFGDASGGRGTTSNEGKSDYDQIADELTQMGVMYSMDYDQMNPRVKDRVESVCALLENGLGEVRMTYNPDRCPLLDGDLRLVGWKPNGKLSDGGDHQRTHASDGAGYAVYKLFPMTIYAERTLSNASPNRPDVV